MKGNKRFVLGKLSTRDFSLNLRMQFSQNGQTPVAAVLACSDSRVPPELIFDQSLGDLFIVRNVGNIADEVTIGGIEYAVETLGVSL